MYMLKTNPTENFTGITFLGDIYDFYELVESIYNVTDVENESGGPYYSASMRILGICYDIRHAYQGDREKIL